MNEQIKPNAFAFKAKVGEKKETQLCICIRENGKWMENDIVFIPEGHPELSPYLDENLFNIIFIGFEKDTENDGFWVKDQNSYYMKSDTALTEDLLKKGEFFDIVEKGYQEFYEQPNTSERKGESSPTSE